MKVNIQYKKISGVYEIVCNDRKYVGSSKDLYGRISLHISHLKRDKHHSKYMQRCFNKYGISSFSVNILHTINYDEVKLRELEFYYINLLKPVFNSTTPITYFHNSEMRERISKTLLRKYKDGSIIHPRLGKGRKYNIYDAFGNLIHENIPCSKVISIFNLSNRSVLNNTIGKNNGYYYNNKVGLMCMITSKNLKDYINYIKSLKNLNGLLVYKIENNNVSIAFNRERFIKKILNSDNLVYYSKKTNCHYTFISLFKNAVLNRNV